MYLSDELIVLNKEGFKIIYLSWNDVKQRQLQSVQKISDVRLKSRITELAKETNFCQFKPKSERFDFCSSTSVQFNELSFCSLSCEFLFSWIRPLLKRIFSTLQIGESEQLQLQSPAQIVESGIQNVDFFNESYLMMLENIFPICWWFSF
jgi:hypothetical protein